MPFCLRLKKSGGLLRDKGEKMTKNTHEGHERKMAELFKKKKMSESFFSVKNTPTKPIKYVTKMTRPSQGMNKIIFQKFLGRKRVTGAPK